MNSGSTAADGTPCILPTFPKTPSYDVHAPLSIESHVHNVGRDMGIKFIYNSQDVTRFGMVSTFTLRNPHVMRHMYIQYLLLHLRLCEQSCRSKSSCTASISGLRRKGALFSRGTLSGGEFELSAVSGYRGALDVGEHSAGLFRNTGRISETRQCGLICPLEERRGGKAGGADLVISMFSACLSVSDFATHRHITFARFVLEVDALLVFYLRCLEYGVGGLLCLSKSLTIPIVLCIFTVLYLFSMVLWGDRMQTDHCRL
jgi:hypothetical protein